MVELKPPEYEALVEHYGPQSLDEIAWGSIDTGMFWRYVEDDLSPAELRALQADILRRSPT